MTIRSKIRQMANSRRVRGVTVSDVISRTGASRSSASAALAEILWRSREKRTGRSGRNNSIYYMDFPF